MVKSFVNVVLPEETAGLAYEIVKKELIEAFPDFVGQNRLREHDWSLKNRIQTNGEVIKETLELVGGDENAVLIKGPGITPTKEQTQSVLTMLDDSRKPEELGKLVTGTPNGYLRGHWLVKGNLERYENPGLSDLLISSLPVYDAAQKPDVLFLEGGRKKDGFFFILDKECEVRVDFNRHTVREPEKLSAGSAVYAKFTRRKDVCDLCDKAIAKRKPVVFMSKYTVRPQLDGEKKKIYNDQRQKAGLKRLEGNQGDIVDAAFARLLARPENRPITVLVPDPSYGPKIATVLSAVYGRGVKRHSGGFSVCRFSAGKSEYGGLNHVVDVDGEYKIVIGSQEYKIPVKAGDMFEEMHYDYADAKRYVKQVFHQAMIKKYDRVVFAFDEADPYDTPVIKAVRETALKLKKVEGDDFLIMKPDEAAVMMFTAPLPGGTCYAYDNLWGDIVSDAIDLGTSIASIDSVILLADGRVWVEMGAAGTAPDLMTLYKKEGLLRYDPIPIIEAFSIGFTQAALKEPENEKLAVYATALHQAYLNVLKKGIATPDLVEKLKQEHKTGVDTLSFVKAVKVELSILLGLKEQEGLFRSDFEKTLKEIR